MEQQTPPNSGVTETGFDRLRSSSEITAMQQPLDSISDGEPHLGSVVGFRVEVDLEQSTEYYRFHVWPATQDTAANFIFRKDRTEAYAFLGVGNDLKSLSSEYVKRLFKTPTLARDLDGLFALVAIDVSRNKVIAIGDRLGVQAIYYARDTSGVWHISTHLMWLLLALQHDGSVEDSGFLSHMELGYALEPDRQVYKGIRKIPAAAYVSLTRDGLEISSYWSMPELLDDPTPDIPTLVEGLRDSMTSAGAEKKLFHGLTAGKDSLCLAAVTPANSEVSAGTLGVPDCADQLQAKLICERLGWPHVSFNECPPLEFPRWASYIAFHSGGLSTASYVDMAAFIEECIPPGYSFVMGDGGESVRDAFQTKGGVRPPWKGFAEDWITPIEYLTQTLSKDRIGQLKHYPDDLVSMARAIGGSLDDDVSAARFYRFQIHGYDSGRHAWLSTLRPKLSPFLGSKFIDHAYSLAFNNHVDSRLHRDLIAHARPELLPFFDIPTVIGWVQDWPTRFQTGVGEVVYRLLEESLPFCKAEFHAQNVLNLCRAVISHPSGLPPQNRVIYHLLRITSLALAKRMLRREASEQLAKIPQVVTKL